MVFAFKVAEEHIRSVDIVIEYIVTMFAEETTARVCVARVIRAFKPSRPFRVIAPECHVAYVFNYLDGHSLFTNCIIGLI